MNDEQPRAEWIFPAEREKSTRRVWLFVGLSVLALVLVGVVLFLLFSPSGSTAEATARPSMSPAPSPGSVSPVPTTSSSTSIPAPDEPAPTPITTPPSPVEPDLNTFRTLVQPRLDDALTGLDLIVNSSRDEALSIIDSLQLDAQWLLDAPAPSGLAETWRNDVMTYSAQLDSLAEMSSIGQGTVNTDSARAAAQALRAHVGL